MITAQACSLCKERPLLPLREGCDIVVCRNCDFPGGKMPEKTEDE